MCLSRMAPRRPDDDEDTVYSFGGMPIAASSVPWQVQILYPNAPPKTEDDKALNMAFDLLRGVKVNQAFPPVAKTTLPN